VLARRRLPEGLDGITRLHALIGEHLPAGWAEGEPARAAAMVKVGIETDRGPWVAALVATGYEVFAINPMSVARYRQRHSTSGAKSDSADAHVLAEIVRLDRGHHRPLAGDSDQGEAIKLAARTHQSLVWDRTRHVLRLRSTLRDFFPAALTAFPDLDAPDALELRRAPDPEQAALRRASRRDVEDKTAQLPAILRAEQLPQPPVIQSAYAAIVTSQVAIIEALNAQIDQLGLWGSRTRPPVLTWASTRLARSLMRPPRMGRRLIRFQERSAMGRSGLGGRSWRLRWGRCPL
jgi:transposase